eukprot:CAMPEP_0115602708 /NCGR_PEP_ID=MMETSP0272-20121206/16051_1 /TAXON_ID=71861 /ORGANISM="Scrippsiella trochoidea, Strain CCMP3099" /LENGTH=396 /DNA_ID=CAMNT_0003038207 /DNA_START=44 /DNA_END=1231 /DNA_ORIENTATION=+
MTCQALPCNAAMQPAADTLARKKAPEHHGSSYLRLGREQPSVVADRDVMIRCYLEDIRRLQSDAEQPPSHEAVHQQAGPDLVVRLVTWNINILMGADGATEVDPWDVASVVESLNADVLVLQEAPEVGLERLWGSAYYEGPVKRVRVLEKLLEGMGYRLSRSPATNGTLLATRLAVTFSEGHELDLNPGVYSVNGPNCSLWCEMRAARFVELALPGMRGPLALYATHLHHKDIERRCDTDVSGVRLREAEVLIRHWRERREVATSQASGEDRSEKQPMATVILADFNQPRSRDHDNEEDWHVVVTGLAHPYVAQPGDDGVADFMEAQGFSCSYDISGAKNNFGERRAPPFTHWTGTTIDFAYVHGLSQAGVEVAGVYVKYTGLSDHLPVVTDLRVS